MQDLKQRSSLAYEVFGEYKDYTRDNLLVGLGTFGLVALVGLLIRLEWTTAMGLGVIAAANMMFSVIFYKQLVRFTFNDVDSTLRISYTYYFTRKDITIKYENLRYLASTEYEGKSDGKFVELKVYEGKKLLLTISKKKYGWTNGLVQEVIKSLKFRKIARFL